MINLGGINIKPEFSDDKGMLDASSLIEFSQKAIKAVFEIKLLNGFGSGFFCKIPYTENDNLLLPVLITCNHVLSKELLNSKNDIEIIIDGETKILSLKNYQRKIWNDKNMDFTCIEIKEKEDNIHTFFYLDDKVLDNNSGNNCYLKKKVIIYGINQNGKKVGLSNGIIEKNTDFLFFYNCNTYPGCSGGAIVNQLNNCIIGFHIGEYPEKEKENKINIGLYIRNVIERIKNINLMKSDIIIEEELSGFLHFCNLKNIARYIDLKRIEDNEIKEIMKYFKEGINLNGNPQEDIKETLSKNDGKNILAFINYLDKKIKYKDVKDLINLIEDDQRKKILDYWSILSKYKDLNKLFEKNFSKMIENSYIDYILVSVYFNPHRRRKEFVENLNVCKNCEARYLLHGTRIDPISYILTTEFKYAKEAYYGMGVYFTDMIDYMSFYCRCINYGSKIIPVGNTISCIASEIFYDKDKKHKIYKPENVILDHFPTYEEIIRHYKDKMIEKNGINFIEEETITGIALESEEALDIARKNGKFIGNEYVITEMEQILPLYGLTLKRNEYLVVWRDSSYGKKIEGNNFLDEGKMFIYKESKMNSFFVGSIEKGLEIIQRKRYNKIILISNIGLDLSGKKFIDVARKILGFDVMVLFISNNEDNLGWLQNFPNALYSNENKFFEKYVSNYNREGLIQLKKEVENKYKIQLRFTNDFLSFPKFADNKRYNDLFFNDINEYFRRVIIINKLDKKALSMENGKVKFISYQDSEIESLIWYITIIVNEITLYSNEFYLEADKNERIAKGYPYMKIWEYELKGSEYLIYFEDKNNVLTIEGDKALLKNENKNQSNQLFSFIDFPRK